MDTYNWDIVCAVSCRELNKKLKVSVAGYFGDFSWSDDVGNQIFGMFDGWKIVAGGDAQRINIVTPLITGRLKVSIFGKDIDVAVDGICPKLQVELAFVSGGNGDGTHLKFNFLRITSKGAFITPAEGSIVVLDHDIKSHDPSDTIIPVLFCQLMMKMLIARRDEIEFIFAELLTIPATSEISWMKLHLLEYAYNEKISGELGCIAVLGIVKSHLSPPGPDKLQLVFDSLLVENEGGIGFMMSRRIFMQQVVLPGLPEVFIGATANQFYLADNDVIRNNGDISLKKLNGYTAYFTNFEMEVVDEKIIINNTRGRCDVVLNSSYVSFDLSAAYIPQLSVVDGISKINLNCVISPVINSQGHDTAAQFFWIFGGWLVDALIQGIRSQIDHLLFEFGRGVILDVYPIKFNTDLDYTECGLAGDFYMRN